MPCYTCCLLFCLDSNVTPCLMPHIRRLSLIVQPSVPNSQKSRPKPLKPQNASLMTHSHVKQTCSSCCYASIRKLLQEVKTRMGSQTPCKTARSASSQRPPGPQPVRPAVIEHIGQHTDMLHARLHLPRHLLLQRHSLPLSL
jgi:hypothetical protein